MKQRRGSFEEAFVEWVRRNTLPGPGVEAGPGDDAAVVDTPSTTLLTTDLLMDGVHFRLGEDPPGLIGRKALAVSLSDIAAMGGRPEFALAQVAFPRSLPVVVARAVHSGLRRMADEFGVQVVGGDTNRWAGRLVIGTTVAGRPVGKPWLVNGGQAGDWILASGEFGGSLAGHHLRFRPACALAEYLASRYVIHAATDVSDSLSIDLDNIAGQSGLAAWIDAAAIPVRRSAMRRQGNQAGGASPLQRALSDGEDFGLLLAVDPETGGRILADRRLPEPLVRIGGLEPGSGLWLLDGDGVRRQLPPRGYQH